MNVDLRRTAVEYVVAAEKKRTESDLPNYPCPEWAITAGIAALLQVETCLERIAFALERLAER